MTTPSWGDVVLVSFPYVELERLRRRPALVISQGCVGDDKLLWVLMITSARHRSWLLDVPLGDIYGEYGLRTPSVVRATKIATIEVRDAETVGRLPPDLLEQVEHSVAAVLGWSGNTKL